MLGEDIEPLSGCAYATLKNIISQKRQEAPRIFLFEVLVHILSYSVILLVCLGNFADFEIFRVKNSLIFHFLKIQMVISLDRINIPSKFLVKYFLFIRNYHNQQSKFGGIVAFSHYKGRNVAQNANFLQL